MFTAHEREANLCVPVCIERDHVAGEREGMGNDQNSLRQYSPTPALAGAGEAESTTDLAATQERANRAVRG